MSREIDILTHHVRAGHLVVEKATNQVWTLPELLEARPTEHLNEEDRLQPPTPDLAVSGPFPGCLQQGSATEEDRNYQLIGQTRHFLLFERGEKG